MRIYPGSHSSIFVASADLPVADIRLKDLMSFSLSLKDVNCFLKIVIIFSLGISLNSSAVNINANTAKDGTSRSLLLHGLFEQFFNIFYSGFYHLSSLAFFFLLSGRRLRFLYLLTINRFFIIVIVPDFNFFSYFICYTLWAFCLICSKTTVFWMIFSDNLIYFPVSHTDFLWLFTNLF